MCSLPKTMLLTSPVLLLAIRRKRGAGDKMQAEKGADYTEVIGKDFYRAEAVNEGHYSKKRADVADVDPKVTPKSAYFLFSPPCFV